MWSQTVMIKKLYYVGSWKVNRNIIKEKMPLHYIVRQNVLICIVSRHLSHFFVSVNFSPLVSSLHCWSIAGFLHGASPKTPLVPRTPSLLVNSTGPDWLWTVLVESAEFLMTTEEQNPLIGTEDIFYFSPEVHKNNFKAFLIWKAASLFFQEKNIHSREYIHII